MKRIAAGLFRQRVRQEAALERFTGGDQIEGILEIAAGLLFGPGSVSGQRFKVELCLVAVERVTIVTAAAAGAFLDEDGLDARDEKAEVGRCGGGEPSEEPK